MNRPNIDPIRAALHEACLICPCCIKTGKEGGVIVGQRGTKKLDGFSYYCDEPGKPYPKKIGSKSSWTGTVPKWCHTYQMQLTQMEEAASDTD